MAFTDGQTLHAADLESRFNSIGYRGDLTVTPMINGSTSGISGTFQGKFVAILNAICNVQIQLSFTAIGSNAGDLTIDLAAANFFNGGTLTSQCINVVNVARLSGVRFGTNIPLDAIVQGKTIRILASQYNSVSGRVFNNTDLTATSYFELSGSYITGN